MLQSNQHSGRRRNPKTYAAIKRAALSLVEKKGYGDASIEAIAKAAGAGKQTIYRWWDNKADLFLEVYLDLASEQKLHVDSGNLSDDIETLLIKLFSIYASSPAAAILAGLVQEAQTDEKIRLHIVEMLITQRLGVVGSLLERAQERGEISANTNIELVVDTLSGAIWLRLFLRHQPLDAAFATQLTRQLISGVSV